MRLIMNEKGESSGKQESTRGKSESSNVSRETLEDVKKT